MSANKKFFVRFMIVVTLFLSIAGCGRLDRWFAGVTGTAAETCIDGVVYLQFTSGATVKYTPEGKVATCR
jgi:hypothetical protein